MLGCNDPYWENEARIREGSLVEMYMTHSPRLHSSLIVEVQVEYGYTDVHANDEGRYLDDEYKLELLVWWCF
jgi:hypothetical protein